MMQNSLERLLEGIAVALQQVQPQLEHGFARAQLRAAIEVLGNLATRVAWRTDYLLASIDQVRLVLAVALETAGDGDLPLGRELMAQPRPALDDAEALEAARSEHFSALAEAQGWAATQAGAEILSLDQAIDGFLRWQLADELARLRTASFGHR